MPRFIRPQATSEHSINWSLFYSLSENNHYLYLLSDLYDPLNEFSDRHFPENSFCKFLTFDSTKVTHYLLGTALQIYHEMVATKFTSKGGNTLAYCMYIQKKELNNNKSRLINKFLKQKITTRIHFSNFLSLDSSRNLMFYKNLSIEFPAYFKQTFLALVGKSEHKGVKSKDIECILTSSSLKFLSRLSFTMRLLFSCWIFNRTLIFSKSNCSSVKFFSQRYRLPGNYFRKVSRFKETPCLSCPIKYECEPQGTINPFECTYFKNWESNY